MQKILNRLLVALEIGDAEPIRALVKRLERSADVITTEKMLQRLYLRRMDPRLWIRPQGALDALDEQVADGEKNEAL